ncbi:hypothetical protein yrohd0001_6440 [Yersinia rohdei ATCC 43380]|nr:hypothetical protein yrohd0001_6440 [Yersinia rohdei ATCC 43380]
MFYFATSAGKLRILLFLSALEPKNDFFAFRGLRQNGFLV